MNDRGGRVQRQAGKVVVVHRRRKRSRPGGGRALGARVRCSYCGELIVLGFMKVGERRFRRAVDVARVDRLSVPHVARFILVRTGQVYKPTTRAKVVNPWHLFTCKKQPDGIRALRDRVLARYDAGLALALGDMAGGEQP